MVALSRSQYVTPAAKYFHIVKVTRRFLWRRGRFRGICSSQLWILSTSMGMSF